MKLREEDFILKLDDDYTMVFDMNTVCDWEELTGKNYAEEFSNMTLLRSSSDQRAMMYCCLLPYHPDITLREAGRIATIHGNALETILFREIKIIENLPKDENEGGTAEDTGVKKKSSTRK